jgi:uncharacterized membrane protein
LPWPAIALLSGAISFNIPPPAKRRFWGSIARGHEVHLFELQPNSSLTPRAAAVFFLSIVAMSLAIAAGFAALGYWPILPFAGLELLGLGAALAVSRARGRIREYIRVEGDTVVVRRVGPGRRSTGQDTGTEVTLPRPWTRVEWRVAGNGHWPGRLWLRAGNRAVEIGAFLTEGERSGLRDRLRQVIPGGSHRDPGDGHGDGAVTTS